MRNLLLNSEMFVIQAEDSRKDRETAIPDNTTLNNTANLPAKLKVCTGARIMLTDNISISDGSN